MPGRPAQSEQSSRVVAPAAAAPRLAPPSLSPPGER